MDVCTGVLAVVTVLAIDGLYYLAASFSSSLSPDDVHEVPVVVVAFRLRSVFLQGEAQQLVQYIATKSISSSSYVDRRRRGGTGRRYEDDSTQ